MDLKSQVNAIGIIFIVISSIVCLSSAVLFVLAVINQYIFLIFFSFFLLLISGFEIFVGIGIKNKKRWARKAGIVFSILWLFSIPIGTAFGIWFLIVLTKDETKKLMYY